MERKTEFVLVANEKGGTAKTATVLLLANCLTRMGYRVCAVDMDPSGNLSAAALPEAPRYVLFDIFNGKCESPETVVKTEICDIIPTQKTALDKSKPMRSFGRNKIEMSKSLGGWFDSMIAAVPNHDFLWQLLRHFDAKFYSGYDFVLIDSSPSDNLPITNCIMAADTILIPCEPVANAVNGLDMFRDTLKMVNDAHANPAKYGKEPAVIDGIILSRYSETSATRRDIMDIIQRYASHEDLFCYRTPVRISPSIEASMNECRPLLDYMYRGHGATDAINFTLEFLARRGLKPRTLIPGTFTDENGNLVFRKKGDAYYTLRVSPIDGSVTVDKDCFFRPELLDDPEWVGQIGKKYFFHQDSIARYISSDSSC